MDKPFALFRGYDYYPSGGMGDYHSSHATVSEARAAVSDPHPETSETGYSWYHIVDVRTMKIIPDWQSWETAEEASSEDV